VYGTPHTSQLSTGDIYAGELLQPGEDLIAALARVATATELPDSLYRTFRGHFVRQLPPTASATPTAVSAQRPAGPKAPGLQLAQNLRHPAVSGRANTSGTPRRAPPPPALY